MMRFFLSFLMFAAIVWSAALVWFVHAMPTRNIVRDTQVEALVVLTGGKDRVEYGFSMLANGMAPVLFISGVGAQVTEEEMLSSHTSAAVRERIYESGAEVILDHVAKSTVSNADQAAIFLRKRGIKTIRLITANYHMKRSVHEFQKVMPQVTILADPVFPSGFRRDEWWQHENTRRLVFSEFYKYFAVLLRDWLKPAA